MAKRKIWIISVVAVLLVLVGLQMALSSGPTDKQLILQALDRSLKASEEGRPGGMIDFLSDSLEFNNELVTDKRQIARFVRDAHPELTVKGGEPEIQGDQATMSTSVRVKFALPMGFAFDQTFDDVQLMFRKEPGTKWLIFPDTKWRLARVVAPNAPNPESWAP